MDSRDILRAEVLKYKLMHMEDGAQSILSLMGKGVAGTHAGEKTVWRLDDFQIRVGVMRDLSRARERDPDLEICNASRLALSRRKTLLDAQRSALGTYHQVLGLEGWVF